MALPRKFRKLALIAPLALLSMVVISIDSNTVDASTITDGAVKTALAQQGTPYQWGGSPSLWSVKSAKATKCAVTHNCTFDCSSLVQYSYSRNGLAVPRTTGEQWNAGKRYPLNKARVGDLVFFSDKNKTVAGITHVGILVGSGQMVEAPKPGKNVRVTTYRDRPGLMPYVVRLT